LPCEVLAQIIRRSVNAHLQGIVSDKKRSREEEAEDAGILYQIASRAFSGATGLSTDGNKKQKLNN
jgi:hypothetical protein